MKLELPRYVTAREYVRKVSFYFVVPKNLRPSTWPKGSIRLPDDLQKMYQDADLLNKRLDAEREGRTVQELPRGSIPLIVREYQKTPEFKALAEHTKRNYDQTIGYLLKWSEKAGHPHIKHLTRPVILKYLTQFTDRPTLRKKIGGMISILCRQAMNTGELEFNPAMDLKLRENRKPPHIYTPEEIEKMVEVAKSMGRRGRGIHRAIITAYSIGQREGDILALRVPENYQGGVFRLTQSKTGQIMEIEAPDALKPHLEGIPPGFLIGKEYKADHFRHVFAEIRDKAGITKNAKFMHFRHTACVRLARAGCTVPEIAAITGHTIQSVHAILKRYLPRDQIVASNAIKKINEYDQKP